MLRVVRRGAVFALVVGVVVDDQFERASTAMARGAWGRGLRAGSLPACVVDPGVGFGDADALAEQLDRFRRIAAAAHADDRGHARIVPAADDAFFDQLDQLALAGDDVGQVQARKFVLPRQRFLEQAAFGQRSSSQS